MAADLHIHVLEPPCEERHVRTLNEPRAGTAAWDEAYERVAATPNVWIGEVSWLNAAITNDERFVPEPVSEVFRLIGDGVVELTPGLGESIMRAVAQDNTTTYSTLQGDEQHRELAAFLVEHSGKPIFTVSW